MSEFKISPAMQCKTRPKRHFLFWFLAVVMIIETIVGGCWIFRLNAKIAKLEQQINTIQTSENKEQVNVQQ